MIKTQGTTTAGNLADPPRDAGNEHGNGPGMGQGTAPGGRSMPPGIANALVLVRILIAYGRHLAAILPVAATWPAYATIARFFPKVGAAEIHARLHRGILRALALERVLLARARRGRDLMAYRRPTRKNVADAVTEPPETPRHRALRRPGYRPDDRWGVWLDRLPSLTNMEKQTRRRPFGSVIGDICLDLGISPKLCAPWFWNGLFSAMHDFRGKPNEVCLELHRREDRFIRDHTGPAPLPEDTRDGVGRVLRFFIGEKPVDPCPPAAPIYPLLAAGAGPPRLLGWT